MAALPGLVVPLAGSHRWMKGGSKVVVIGGGVIGLCCGYFLATRGHRVVVVDRDPTRRESCSDRNAGMIVPSHFIPLAAPGVISQGLRWMLNRRSPFYLRPRLDANLWAWCWRFFRHSNRRHVENSRELLRDLSLESRALFGDLAEELGFELVEKGLLMLSRSEAGLAEESEVAAVANGLGIEAEVCPPERLRELDPGVDLRAIGGVWFPRDAHLDSERFLDRLRWGIRSQGGELENREVVDFHCEGDSVSRVSLANGEQLDGDHFVMAAGAWTQGIAGKLDLRLPMQAGKGYSFTLENPAQLPDLCSLLKEGRVAVTPMGDTLRVAGTMEICGNDLSVDPLKLEGIIESFCGFFPAFRRDDFRGLEPWVGLRPCSPDGLPYIGRVPGVRNAFVATGHAMLGLSLGPVTARLVSDLISGERVDQRLEPARF